LVTSDRIAIGRGDLPGDDFVKREA